MSRPVAMMVIGSLFILAVFAVLIIYVHNYTDLNDTDKTKITWVLIMLVVTLLPAMVISVYYIGGGNGGSAKISPIM